MAQQSLIAGWHDGASRGSRKCSLAIGVPEVPFARRYASSAISMLQRYVGTTDLDKIHAAVSKSLRKRYLRYYAPQRTPFVLTRQPLRLETYRLEKG